MKLYYKAKKFLLLFILLSAAIAVGSQPYCRTKTFSFSQGLTTNHVTHFEQDSNGLMWLSSINGLWTYDGYDFMSHRAQGLFSSITTQRYLSVRANYKGGVYLTDNNRQVYLFDTRSNTFHSISKILRSKGIEMKVADIRCLADGHTWLIGKENTSPRLVRINDNTILSGNDIEEVTSVPLKGEVLDAIVCPVSGELVYGDIGVCLPGRGQIYSRPVYALLEFDQYVLWGGEGNILSVYNPKQKAAYNIPFPEGTKEINGIVRLDKQRIACGTNIGVVVCDMKTHEKKVINVQNPASPSNHVKNLFLDSSKRLWVYTDSDGLTLIEPDLEHKTWLMAQACDPSKRTTCKFTIWLEDNQHTIWTIPRGGTFSYYDEAAHRLVAYPVFEQGEHECTIPEIGRAYVDNSNNLWVTGVHSFNMLSFGKYKTTRVVGERFGNVRAVTVDGSGNVWTGNEKGHLMVYDSSNRLIGYMSPIGKIMTVPVVFSKSIYSLYQDNQGRLWIGTNANGLFVRNVDGTVVNYRNVKNNPASLSGNRVNSIIQDRLGRIWVGAYSDGLNLVVEKEGKISFINKNNGLGKAPLDDDFAIRSLSTTANGVIIMSTVHGMVTFSDNFRSPSDIEYHFFNMPDGEDLNAYYDVVQTEVMKSGKVYMATISGEVFEIDTESLLSSPRGKAIFDDVSGNGPINSMFEDKSGNLWIVRESNIERYSPQTGKINTFWPKKTARFSVFTEAQPGINLQTGVVAIGSQDGYLTFNPSRISFSDKAPKILFTSLLFNGENQTQPIFNREEIQLPAGKRSLTISFASLDYAENQFIKYAYKLEGVDKQWNNIGFNHRVSFNDLPSGTYTLMVRSTNSDGQWTDNTKKLIIKVLPEWWETWWANLLLLCIIGGILYLLYKYYKVRRRAEIEEAVSKRKTMLYREASHKLRTPLTLIGGPIVEVMKSKQLTVIERYYLEIVRYNSRKMLNLVDNMLSDNMEGSYFVDDENAPVFANENVDTASDENADEQLSTEGKQTRILVVEDNDNLRSFLESLLSTTYTVLTAENGKEGLELAMSKHPDFILTDVTMPVMDGLTMVGMIKRKPEICHIPIIILSARASIEDKIQGIEQGIDDYITKPFSAHYLKQRMAEVIAKRRAEQRESMEEIQNPDNKEYTLSSVKVVDYDRQMMTTLMAYLEENISRTELRIDDMAAAVNMSRSVFYTKLKAIVGMSPTDFVKNLRLKRATELIVKTTHTFAEIAIAVGFSDQRYFSRVFKKATGMTPSQYRDAHRE